MDGACTKYAALHTTFAGLPLQQPRKSEHRQIRVVSRIYQNQDRAWTGRIEGSNDTTIVLDGGDATSAPSRSNRGSGGSSSSAREASLALASALKDPRQTFPERYHAVRAYLDALAKPVGSLGALEDFAARIAALQRSETPKIDKAACLIFAADHGVAKDRSEGGMNCSSYPQAVSRKVLEGLDRGMAGASVLARCNDVELRVIDVGLADGPTEYEWRSDGVRTSEKRLRGGTQNFCTGDAMTEDEVGRCMMAGIEETRAFVDETNADLIAFGEVGIGNTTTSSALIAALTGEDTKSLCGTGASTTRDGIDDEAIAKKVSIVKEAMKYHGPMKGQPRAALRAVGGAEIAAMAGGMLEASDRDIPILVDGFIVTTAAMIACMLTPEVARVLLFATQSTERGQAAALRAIGEIATANDIPAPAAPALNMELRMGEATGALMAVPLARSACAIVSELATLDEVLGIEMR